jgi:hypothetical protein
MQRWMQRWIQILIADDADRKDKAKIEFGHSQCRSVKVCIEHNMGNSTERWTPRQLEGKVVRNTKSEIESLEEDCLARTKLEQ